MPADDWTLFLQKAFPNLPQALMYKYIRKKRIKVNGKRAEISLRLSAGDTISLYIADALMEKPQYTYDFLHAGKALSIAYFVIRMTANIRIRSLAGSSAIYMKKVNSILLRKMRSRLRSSTASTAIRAGS